MSSASSRTAPVGAGVGRVLARLEAVRPLYVLSALVAAEWLVTLAVALKIDHNGWLYDREGDQLWHYVTSWLLVHGHLGHAAVGYGWSVVLFPFALLGGPDMLNPLPAIVLLDTLVLMPIALVAVYAIGRRIGGRVFGYWTAALWIVVPLIGIRYADAEYHHTYTDFLLPQALGLTASSSFASLVVLAVAAYFSLRAAQGGPLSDALLAGALAGVALGIKPINAPFLAGAVLALIYGRRWRGLVGFAAGLAPPLIALAIWKARGNGHLSISLHELFSLHLGRLAAQHDGLREYFWSARLLEWLAVAGLIALFRRSRIGGLLFGGWFVANLLVAWTGPGAGTIATTASLRRLVPGLPAAVVLLAALPFLLPGLPQRLAPPEPVLPWGKRRLRTGVLTVLLVLFAVVPIALSALPTARPGTAPATFVGTDSLPFAVDDGWHLHAGLTGTVVHLDWPARHPAGGDVQYVVQRAPAGAAVDCDAVSGGAVCRLLGSAAATTGATQDLDRPARGRWTYRVIAVAAWDRNALDGHPYVVSPPVTVRVG